MLDPARAKDLKEKIISGRDGLHRFGSRNKRKDKSSDNTTKACRHYRLVNFVARVMSPAMSSETLSLDSVAMELLGEGEKGIFMDEMKERMDAQKKALRSLRITACRIRF